MNLNIQNNMQRNNTLCLNCKYAKDETKTFCNYCRDFSHFDFTSEFRNKIASLEVAFDNGREVKDLQSHDDDCDPKLGMVQNQEEANSWNGVRETDSQSNRLEFNGKRYRAVQGACSKGCALHDPCNHGQVLCMLKGGEMWEEMPEQNHFTGDGKMLENNRIRPDYYVINGVECKDVIGEFTYNIGAAMKYLWRHGRKSEEGMTDKDKAIEDLRKAIQHIEFEIKRLEK